MSIMLNYSKNAVIITAFLALYGIFDRRIWKIDEATRQEWLGWILGLGVSGIILFTYMYMRCNMHMLDILSYQFNFFYGIGGWSLTHFAMYAILGFYFPRLAWPMLLTGALFEFFEHSLYSSKKTHLCINKYHTKEFIKSSSSDFFINTGGLVLGMALSHLVGRSIDNIPSYSTVVITMIFMAISIYILVLFIRKDEKIKR